MTGGSAAGSEGPALRVRRRALPTTKKTIARSRTCRWPLHGTNDESRRTEMARRRIVVLFGIVLIGAVSAWSQQRGYVMKPGEGEHMPGERRTILKASPRTGTQGVEMFRDTM